MKLSTRETTHPSDPRILNRRTLQRDHQRLAQVLRAGMTVLDVGCGAGAITADIAGIVGRGGMAVGLDRDDGILAIARQEHRGTDNLRFDSGDILTLDFERDFKNGFDIDILTLDFERDFKNGFDIVTAARTLLWISEPDRAIGQMKRAAKAGGCVMILDYSLEDTRWEPDPPADFKRFFRTFLDWRTANDWDNRMAEHLPELFHTVGLTAVEIHSCDEIVQRGELDFFDA